MRCGVLFTGGLDGQLAVRLLQAQQFDVAAICFRSVFADATAAAEAAAQVLGVPLTLVDLSSSYSQRLRQPRLGYAGGAAPCLDCRIAMLTHARQWMREIGAEFVATGDVVGQRVRTAIRDFEIVDHHAGLERRVLRPLCARLLPATNVEERGAVDRSQLLACEGKSRRPQEQLARQLGLTPAPPRPDCPLLSEPLAARAMELIRRAQPPRDWELELLAIGRQFQLDEQTRAIVGRNRGESDRLAAAARGDAPPTALITAANFAGPTALVIGEASEANVQRAAQFVARYSRHLPPEPLVRVHQAGRSYEIACLDNVADDARQR